MTLIYVRKGRNHALPNLSGVSLPGICWEDLRGVQIDQIKCTSYAELSYHNQACKNDSRQLSLWKRVTKLKSRI